MSGHLNATNAPIFNAKLEVASNEVRRLAERLEALTIETTPLVYNINEVKLIIREYESLAQAMQHLEEEPEKQRRVLVTHIKEIAEQSDGSFL